MMKRDIPLKRFTVAVLLFLAVICLSCSSAPVLPEFTTGVKLKTYQQVTLEEASDILGVTLPEPAYLPKGLQVQEVYVYYQDGITRLKYNIECRMRLQINWLGGEKFIPIKVPPGLETVKISGRVGFIREKANVNTLTWQFPEFELYLSASRDAPKEELIKVAESVKPVSVT